MKWTGRKNTKLKSQVSAWELPLPKSTCTPSSTSKNIPLTSSRQHRGTSLSRADTIYLAIFSQSVSSWSSLPGLKWSEVLVLGVPCDVNHILQPFLPSFRFYLHLALELVFSSRPFSCSIEVYKCLPCLIFCVSFPSSANPGDLALVYPLFLGTTSCCCQTFCMRCWPFPFCWEI